MTLFTPRDRSMRNAAAAGPGRGDRRDLVVLYVPKYTYTYVRGRFTTVISARGGLLRGCRWICDGATARDNVVPEQLCEIRVADPLNNNAAGLTAIRPDR